MLLFLAYPLSFFGSRIPDRVVKAELLRFMLRGPAAGMLILATMIFMPEVVFGIPNEDFMAFAVVGVVLFWAWMVDLSLPTLEKFLIYHDEDDEQIGKILSMSRRILTRNDSLQMLEGILEAGCDYLQINNAFIAGFNEGQAEIIKATGDVNNVTQSNDNPEGDTLPTVLQMGRFKPQRWLNYWVMPLYTRRSNGINKPPLIGVMGLEARPDVTELTIDEEQVLKNLRRRAAQTVDDLMLQTEIYAALEGLLPQIAAPPSRVVEVEYRSGRSGGLAIPPQPNRELIIEQVQAALRHYWGGPGLTNSRLLELNIVRAAIEEHDNNPVKALRSVLRKAIENQRPPGERDYKSQEWTIYNILQLRFVENRKVRETAQRLYLAEATLYRKQNLAIEAVADSLIQMEIEAVNAVQ
jgi:hypothetical protein